MPTSQPQRCVTFEERDGLYWLTGRDLELARHLLRLQCQADCVGFDPDTASIYFRDLLRKRTAVAWRRGEVVRIVKLHQASGRPSIEGKALWVEPEALTGRAELDRLIAQAGRNHSRLRARVEQLKSELTRDKIDPIVIYQVTGDWYEVDWELTVRSELDVQALVVAAYETEASISCRLVPPKPRRGKHAASGVRPIFEVSNALTYGQLRLAL